MKNLYLFFFAIVMSVMLIACKTRQDEHFVVPVNTSLELEHSPDVLLVLYDSIVGKQPLLDALKKMKAEVVYDYNMMAGMAIRKPQNLTLEQTMEKLKMVKGVLSVEYDHIYHLTDPVRPKQPFRQPRSMKQIQ